jgi:phosphatidylglycerophosphate synthase
MMMQRIRNFLGRAFPEQYANHAAVGDNYVLLLMYRFASPFALALHRMKLTPNQITTCSLVFSMLAAWALAFDSGWICFAAFWWVSVLLDFCDGTVARMSNSVSKAAFRYDHMSDLFKLSLLFLAAALRYDDVDVWVISFIATFIFLYFNILNMELAGIYRRKPKIVHSEMPVGSRSRDRYKLVAWLVRHDRLYFCVKSVYAAIVTVTGHTLLLFFVLPVSKEAAIGVFIYLIVVMTYGIQSRIRTLLGIER